MIKKKGRATFWVGFGAVATFCLFLIALLTWIDVKPNPNLIKEDIPFEIKISPTYFDEGNYEYNYDKIPFSIEIIKKNKRNITFLELSKSNFKTDRDDKELNKPTSSVIWKDSRSENIFYFNSPNIYPTYFSNMKAEGAMNLCKNCFIGDNYPYVFTFTIYYKEGESELKSKTFNEIIPIK